MLIQKGNEVIITDSVIVFDNTAKFQLKNKKKGLFYIQFNDTNRVEILVNPNEASIVFKFDDCKLNNSLKVIESKENQLFWDYKFYTKDIADKIKAEHIFQSNIPKSDVTMHSFSEQKIVELNNKKSAYLKKLTSENPDLFFTESVLLFEKLNEKFPNKSTGQRALLESIPFNKTEYLNTMLFPAAIMSVLQNHTEYTEDGFKNAVDQILLKAKVSDEVYAYCLSYLLDLFKRVGPEVIFDYLIETHLLSGSCSTDEIKTNYAEVIKSYQVMQPGNKAPDFFIESKGIKYNLSDLKKQMKHEKMILFFYSSHCEFCHKLLEELLQDDSMLKKADFVFISLDNNIAEWENFVKENKLPGINLCDLNGWKSEVVLKYKVHKTPTFFILNENMEIVIKGSSMTEFKKVFD